MTSAPSALPPEFIAFREAINRLLTEYICEPGETSPANRQELSLLEEACSYSVSNGGKRARPLLLYGAALAIDPAISADKLYPVAAAVEMIHSYSLVHDDLPAMDDDDLRRGKATNHRVYGEGMAILVGDGLQARAIELLATAQGLTTSQRLELITTLCAAAGNRGMVGGQAIDIQRVGKTTALDALKHMHELKTGALIRAALRMGGICAGAEEDQYQSLDKFGAATGLGFQVVDDILDVEGNTAILGKTGGKDAIANKPTYVSLLGMQAARDYAAELLQQSRQALAPFDNRAQPLYELADYLIAREH